MRSFLSISAEYRGIRNLMGARLAPVEAIETRVAAALSNFTAASPFYNTLVKQNQ
jgi:hypothetical protein